MSDPEVNIVIRATDKTKDVLGGLTDGFQSFGKIATGVVVGAMTAVTGAVTATAITGILDFIQFEDKLNEVFTLLPGISEQSMGEMSNDIKAFSVEFGRLPEEVIPALYQALSAGVPQDNVFSFLEVAHMAAIGGVAELETAVDGISSVINAYGVDTISASEASDLMFTAVRLGKTTFDELSSSLFQVIPTAAGLGIEFGDVTAALASLTAQGVPTSVATTQMRQLFLELGKEGGKAAGVFETMAGVSFKEFIASGGNTAEALDLMRIAAEDMDVGINDLFGSVEAGSAALALSGSETFVGNLDEMANSTGATEIAFEKMQEGFARVIDVAKAFGKVFLLDVGEAFKPVLDVIASLVEEWLPVLQTYLSGVMDTVSGKLETAGKVIGSFFANMDEGMSVLDAFIEAIWDIAPQPVLDFLVNFRDVLLPIIRRISDAVTSFVSWKDVLAGVGLAIATFVLPIVWGLITAIASILAPVLLVIGVIALLRNAWENDWGGIQTKLTAFWQDTLMPFVSVLQEWLAVNLPIWLARAQEFFSNAWTNVILPAVQAVWAWLDAVLIPFLTGVLFPWLAETIPAALTTLKEFWLNVLLPGIQAVWAWLNETLMPFLTGTVVPFLKDNFTAALTILSAVWENVLLPIITTVWTFIKDNLYPLIIELVKFFNEVFQLAITALAGIFENLLIPVLTALRDYVSDNLGPAMLWLKQAVVDPITQAFQWLSEKVQWVIDKISSLTQMLGGIKLPDWMTPGSATPWEIGLRGVSAALTEVNQKLGQQARMQTQLAIAPSPIPAYAPADMPRRAVGMQVTNLLQFDIDARYSSAGTAQNIESVVRKILREYGQATESRVRVRA